MPELGPTALPHSVLRKIIHQKRFKRCLKKYFRKKITWSSPELSTLKDEIRSYLRAMQDNRCIFCRRRISQERRNSFEDIEHFLDKSKTKYYKWSFSCVNLALSCHACNLEKGQKDLLPINVQDYKNNHPFSWLHPYFDQYHDNISIDRGWVYSLKKNAPKYDEARQMIFECKLYLVKQTEAEKEVIKNKQEQYILEIQAANRNNDQALVNQLCQEMLNYTNEHRFS